MSKQNPSHRMSIKPLEEGFPELSLGMKVSVGYTFGEVSNTDYFWFHSEHPNGKAYYTGVEGKKLVFMAANNQGKVLRFDAKKSSDSFFQRYDALNSRGGVEAIIVATSSPKQIPDGPIAQYAHKMIRRFEKQQTINQSSQNLQ